MAAEDSKLIDTQAKDKIVVEQDPLSLDISDSTLIKFVNSRIKKANATFKAKNIPSRQRQNFEYWKGRQIDESKLKDFEPRYVDNTIYEAEGTIKPIVLSKMPDMLVKQTENTEDSKKNADNLTDVINSDLHQRRTRKILSIAVKHVPIYFTAIIKPRWDPEKGEDGDYVFDLVHPQNIVFDDTCMSNNPDDMDFIAEAVELSVKEIIMRFPKKKDEFIQALSIASFNGDEKNEEKMATKVKIWEVWFTWYVDEGQGKYSRQEGVLWKYKGCLLAKMKNPNWDWEGQDRVFTFDTAKDKKTANQQDMRQAMMMAMQPDMTMDPNSMDQMQSKKIYKNHFDNPRKPYIVLGYDQMGTMAYDETSRIEQVKLLQDNVNKRGKQISDLADQAKGKPVFSTKSGLKKTDIEELDMGDPNTGLLVDGKANESFFKIPGEMPSPALYEDQDLNRNRIFDMMGTHGVLRGKKETHVATTAQISREQDFSRIDDFTEEIVNFSVEEMSNWAMQFIKLRYTKNHMRRLLGKDGEMTLVKVNSDMVEDGMEVVVYATSVDKLMRQRAAFEMAKMQLTDPLTFFEDTGVSNPKERTLRLLTFMQNKDQYIAKFVMGLKDSTAMANALPGAGAQSAGSPPSNGSPTSGGQPPQGGAMPPPSQPPQQPGGAQPGQPPIGQPGQGSQQAIMDIQMLSQGQQPPAPQNLDPEYIQTFDRFLSSPEFKNMPPEAQQAIIRFAQGIAQSVQQLGGGGIGQ